MCRTGARCRVAKWYECSCRPPPYTAGVGPRSAPDPARPLIRMAYMGDLLLMCDSLEDTSGMHGAFEVAIAVYSLAANVEKLALWSKKLPPRQCDRPAALSSRRPAWKSQGPAARSTFWTIKKHLSTNTTPASSRLLRLKAASSQSWLRDE